MLKFKFVTVVFFGMIAVVVGFVLFVKMIDRMASFEDNDFNVVCLENVEYWWGQKGHKAVLAAKFDAKTGEIVTCE